MLPPIQSPPIIDLAILRQLLAGPNTIVSCRTTSGSPHTLRIEFDTPETCEAFGLTLEKLHGLRVRYLASDTVLEVDDL